MELGKTPLNTINVSRSLWNMVLHTVHYHTKKNLWNDTNTLCFVIVDWFHLFTFA